MGQKGLTFIEVLITVTILAILASVVLPLSQMSVKRDKELELKRSLRIIRTAIDEYKALSDSGRIDKSADESGYPPDLLVLVAGVELREIKGKGGLSAPAELRRILRRIPRDPVNPNPYVDPEYSWGLRCYESDHDNPYEGDDVFDVYSLSDEIAIDGTLYSSW